MSEWIDIREGLPEDDGLYLVNVIFCGYGLRRLAYFSSHYDGLSVPMRGRMVWYDFSKDQGDYELTTVTHWAKIPDPIG